MSFITKEKRLEYRKRYIEKHGRDKINADQRKRTKKFRDKNPEKSKEYQRTYKKKNFEKWKTYHRLKNERVDQRFKKSMYSAIKRKKEWTLSFDEFKQFAEQPCSYCNGLLGTNKVGSGLDRIDNNKGYVPGNICSSCGFCNKLRGDRLTHEETKKVVHFIIELRNLNDEEISELCCKTEDEK